MAHREAGGTHSGQAEPGEVYWWSPASVSLAGDGNQGISVTFWVKNDHFLLNCNENFQLILNPGFSFT